jgi:hypothetical protein
MVKMPSFFHRIWIGKKKRIISMWKWWKRK